MYLSYECTSNLLIFCERVFKFCKPNIYLFCDKLDDSRDKVLFYTGTLDQIQKRKN